MSFRTQFRAVLVASIGMLCMGLLAGPASAADEPVSNAEKQIQAFLTQYKDAVAGSTGAGTPQQIRAKFLSPELDKRLTDWAQQNHVDPVFRAQGLPQSWSMKYQGSGLGVSKVTVTHTWADGRSTVVQYSVQLEDQLIVDLYS